MKKICFLILFMSLMMVVKCDCVNANSGNKIYINNEKGLKTIARIVNTGLNDLYGYVIFIEADILLKEYEPIGNINHPFRGIIDGRKHNISIVKNEVLENDLALVGCLGEKGQVKNVRVIAEIKGRNRVAGIVGYNKGTVKHCATAGKVSGQSEVGGIVGANAGKIYKCLNGSIVVGEYATGGIAGCSDFSRLGSQIINCTNLGDVFGYNCVGTICAIIYGTKIEGCKNECRAWQKIKQSDIKYVEVNSEVAYTGRSYLEKAKSLLSKTGGGL